MQSKPEVGLVIDLENIATSLWQLNGQQPVAADLMAHARQYGLVSFARVYADFAQERFHQMERAFRNANVEPFSCPSKTRAETTQSTVDMNMVIDLYETAQDRPNIEVFVLMSGDSDFVRVVGRLRHRFGKRVVIAGVPGSVSRDLVDAAGEEDPLDGRTLAMDEAQEAAVVRAIDRYETSRYEDVLPTFRGLAEYLKHPTNRRHIDTSIVEGKLNDFETRGIVVRPMEGTREQPVRTIRLDRANPLVAQALAGDAPAGDTDTAAEPGTAPATPPDED